MTRKMCNSVVVMFCLALFVCPSRLPAAEGYPFFESSQAAAVGTGSVGVGVGVEVSHGDYGVNADATLLSLPLSLFWQSPENKRDITLEIPFLYLSSRADSGIVVTSSGGAGRRRGAPTAVPVATATSTITTSGVGDISMTAGWTLWHDTGHTPSVRPTLYLKVPSGDEDRGLGTGTLEAGPGLSVSRWVGAVQLFGEAAFIFQASRSDYPGQNYLSYQGGAGIQVTNRLFVSALAKGSSARSDGADAQAEGRLKLNFLQSRRINWEIYGSAGFTDASPDYGGGLMMVYQF